MKETERPLLHGSHQARGAELKDIASLLAKTIANPTMRFEVSRRDHILYVFLTPSPPNLPETYAEAVYEAIARLQLINVSQLTVLDGCDRPLIDRWHQSFLLPTPDLEWIGTNNLTPEPTDLTSETDGLALNSVAPLNKPRESAQAPFEAREEQLEAPVQFIATPEGLPNLGDQSDPPAGSSPLIRGDSPGAIAPLPPALWVEPIHYGSRATTTAILEKGKGRSLRRWGEVVLGLTALGLAAGAGYAYWQNQQEAASTPQATSTLEAPTSTASSPPSSLVLAPVFTQDHLADLVPTALQAPATLTINAVGDIIPGTDYRTYRLPQDWQYLFRSIQHQLNQADLVFGNFESTLTEVPTSAKDTSRAMTFAFRTPPWYASVLKEAGFDVLSVANNHSFDFGEQGFAETIGHIEAAGMKAVGRKGQILYVEVDNTTVAFIGFSYLNTHNSVQDMEAAAALVQEADRQADIVVVSFHAGKEGTDAIATRDQTEYFYSENRGNVVQFSRTVIDYGADLVLGHGPHVPRALELYNNKLIAYSLGNFLGYRTLSTVGPLGVSLILTTNLNAQGDFVSGRIIPVTLDANGVPYLDDYFQSVILMRTYTRQDFPQTPLVVDDLGYIWRSP